MIGPDRDGLARQRRPVSFVDGGGRAAHRGGGDDADTHQGIGAFFTWTSTTASAVLMAGRLYSGRGSGMRIERVLTSHGRYCLPLGVVAIDAGQQFTVGAQVIPLAAVLAEIVMGDVGLGAICSDGRCTANQSPTSFSKSPKSRGKR